MRCCGSTTTRDNEAYGVEAVSALADGLDGDRGTTPEQVFKTLVVTSPRGLAVAVLPVPSQLSLKAAAAALGVGEAAMAERAAAERSTGYVVGGISPFGQRKRLPTVVDSSAMRWDRVLCSAGKRGWDVAVAPAGPRRTDRGGDRRHSCGLTADTGPAGRRFAATRVGQ